MKPSLAKKQAVVFSKWIVRVASSDKNVSGSADSTYDTLYVGYFDLESVVMFGTMLEVSH